jgi:PiT family inorganic phosphate transporter
MTVIGAAIFGGPVSSTQTATSAILGVGASDNPRTLHWQTVFRIVGSWFLTAPTALCAGALATFILRVFH